MTTYDYGTTTPTQTGAGGGGGAREQAQQAASTAADEGKRVADVAKDEARSVAGDAQQQARNLVDEAKSQIDQQSRSQLDSLLTTLQGFADDLGKMTRGEQPANGLAQDLVTQVGDHARTLSDNLQGREPSEILDQARDFARRRPGTFLLGALAAGVVAGRLARGAKDAHSDGGPTSAAAPSTGVDTAVRDLGATDTAPRDLTVNGTAAGDPLAGTGAPAETPVYPADGPTPGGTL